MFICLAMTIFDMIALYMEDIPAACNDATWLTLFKARLGANFKIKDLVDISQLLCMHNTRDKSARTILLDQSKYLRDIPIAKHGMIDCKPLSLMMDLGFMSGLARMDSPPLLSEITKDAYPSILGSY
jgi:hypothetical protein